MIGINGDNKFLRITVGNLLTIATTLGLVIGLYYKIDGRVSTVERIQGDMEKNGAPTNLTERVGSLEKKLDDLGPRIIRTDTNVLWLMSKQSGAPKE